MTRLPALLLAAALVSPATALAAAQPVATIATPSDGSSVPMHAPLMVAGGATNGESGGVTYVEVSTDGGANWTIIDARTERWQFNVVPTAPGPLTLVARAHTASGAGPVTASRTVYVDGRSAPELPSEGEHTLSLPSQPAVNDPDGNEVELGVRTRFDRPGFLTGTLIRRGDHTGPVTANVWSASGELLASQEAGDASGTQRITFAEPVRVAPHTEYVISYYTPSGGYAVTEHYFSGGVAQTPFYAPPDAGVYVYGGGFPSETWHASNYWIQPIFLP